MNITSIDFFLLLPLQFLVICTTKPDVDVTVSNCFEC